MIGIFLITHAGLGEAFVQTACHILGTRPPQLLQLGVAAQDCAESLLPLAQQQLELCDSGKGVLILNDIFGATPANLAQKLVHTGRIEALSGVNLPMLLRALRYRQNGMDFLLDKAMSGATSGVMRILPP